MQVTLSCADDQATIRFEGVTVGLQESPFSNLPGAWLILGESGMLAGIRITALDPLCPYELRKAIGKNAGCEIRIDLLTPFDASCDMGYIYLEKRGPAPVAFTVGSMDTGVLADIGKDGVILGFEVFTPSRRLPALANC